MRETKKVWDEGPIWDYKKNNTHICHFVNVSLEICDKLALFDLIFDLTSPCYISQQSSTCVEEQSFLVMYIG